MRSNGLLKWLMIPMVLLLVFVGFKLLSGGDRAPAQQGAGQQKRVLHPLTQRVDLGQLHIDLMACQHARDRIQQA